MPVIDETHGDLIQLVERDFGPVSSAGSKLIESSRQRWAEQKTANEGDPPEYWWLTEAGCMPPRNWYKASNAQRQEVEQYLIFSWLHYRARLIPRRRRAVSLSQRARAEAIAYPQIHRIVDALAQSGDCTPYLSRELHKGNVWNHLTDPLFSANMIHHFHLGRMIDRNRNISGTKKLLFAYVSANESQVIGVFDHDFGNPAIIDRLFDESPNYFTEMKGMLVDGGGYSAEEARKLAKAGAVALYHRAGKAYLRPGHGVANSGHANRVVDTLASVWRAKTRLLKGSALPFRVIPRRLGLRYRVNGVIQLYDKDIGQAYFNSKPLE